LRPVHLLGLGSVVGMLALGVMLAVIGFQWQEATYRDVVVRTDVPPPGAPGPATPAQLARGQTLYEQRCAGCHTIGGGDLAGPDLIGVTERRPYSWIQQIIVDPQRLIQASDPIMLDLMGRYPASMPNTGTSPAEAANMIAYIHSESPEPSPALRVPRAPTPEEEEPTPAEPAQTPAAEEPAAPPAQTPATKT
jgi:mono/diheme cytochrome c family protein